VRYLFFEAGSLLKKIRAIELNRIVQDREYLSDFDRLLLEAEEKI